MSNVVHLDAGAPLSPTEDFDQARRVLLLKLQALLRSDVPAEIKKVEIKATMVAISSIVEIEWREDRP